MASNWLTARIDKRWPNGKVLLVVDPPPAGEVPLPSEQDRLLVRLRQPRNIKHHRKYWALVRAACGASGLWHGNNDLCHLWLKHQTGHVDLIRLADGTEIQIPKSINFASMGQREFSTYYDRAIFALSEATGVDVETLGREADAAQ